VRIGVLTDCQGPLRPIQDGQLSGAELPFVQRGASLRGASPTTGTTAIRIGGREVELVLGCAESGEHTVYIEEARRLVEQEHVDAVVGGASVVSREVARRYPDVPFVDTFWDEPATTLRRPAQNLFRYSLDSSQKVAGLGRYAYDELGWRRAAVLAGQSPEGWAAAAAFTAEFCALGGAITRSTYVDPLAPQKDITGGAVAGAPDGVALLAGPFDPVEQMTDALLPRLGGPPARHLLLSSIALEDAQLIGPRRRRLEGVVSTSFIPAGRPTAALRRYRAAYAAAFPSLPRETGDASYVLGYYDSVEALLQALEQVHGDVSGSRGRLRAALRDLRLELPRGRVRLDANRQAVVDVPLVRIGAPGAAATPVGVSRNVEQTFSGLLSEAPPPGPGTQPCRKATPPPWAG
jgi:branched-chain amino acid transport system substrate-binding protein